MLDDENKTAVIHQRGMGAVLGFSRQSGARFPRFINAKGISGYIGPELRQKLENPIVFQGVDTVAGDPSSKKLYGFDVTLLIDNPRYVGDLAKAYGSRKPRGVAGYPADKS